MMHRFTLIGCVFALLAVAAITGCKKDDASTASAPSPAASPAADAKSGQLKDNSAVKPQMPAFQAK